MNQATHLYREGMAELREENEQLKARIAELESELNLLKQERDFWQAVEKEREG